MTTSHISGQPERPRSEPEIIPPGHDRDPLLGAARFGRDGHPVDAFVFTSTQGRTGRVRIKRISPFAAIAILFGVAFAVMLILLLVIGAVLVWIPVAAAIVLGLLAFGRLRDYWRRLRGAR